MKSIGCSFLTFLLLIPQFGYTEFPESISAKEVLTPRSGATGGLRSVGGTRAVTSGRNVSGGQKATTSITRGTRKGTDVQRGNTGRQRSGELRSGKGRGSEVRAGQQRRGGERGVNKERRGGRRDQWGRGRDGRWGHGRDGRWGLGGFRGRGGRTWWNSYRDRIWSSDFIWPDYPVFNDFFTSELAILPTLNIPPNILNGLIDEIHALQDMLAEQQEESGEINRDARERIAALINKLLENDPNLDVQQLFGQEDEE